MSKTIVTLAFGLAMNLATQALAQTAPAQIPLSSQSLDRTGQIATIDTLGPTTTAGQPFFQSLGSNGRTCFTCHQPQNAWSVSPPDLIRRFNATNGTDPIFRSVDGATCASADVSTTAARLKAYDLLINRGLLHVQETLPATTEFSIQVSRDPYGCAKGPGENGGVALSAYRRILPSTNLRFAAALMWDGRYPDLAAQASDATLDHAQAAQAPRDAQILAITDFESALFTAQATDNRAGFLDQIGGRGGPIVLANLPFYPGINDSAGRDPKGKAFDRRVFTLYDAFEGPPLGTDDAALARAAIGRGQRLFNTRTFTIANVPGLTDNAPGRALAGTCSTCHDTPNVGSRSLPDFLDIGVADSNPPGLNTDYLPLYTLTCTAPANNGGNNGRGPQNPNARQVQTTDPGRALVTGLCADVGRFKVPALRGLAARAPYFHNGAAQDLGDVVGFYDRRFRIGLNQQDRADLVAFLQAL